HAHPSIDTGTSSQHPRRRNQSCHSITRMPWLLVLAPELAQPSPRSWKVSGIVLSSKISTKQVLKEWPTKLLQRKERPSRSKLTALRLTITRRQLPLLFGPMAS